MSASLGAKFSLADGARSLFATPSDSSSSSRDVSSLCSAPEAAAGSAAEPGKTARVVAGCGVGSLVSSSTSATDSVIVAAQAAGRVQAMDRE